MQDDQGNPVANRPGKTQIAIDFYKKLYSYTQKNGKEWKAKNTRGELSEFPEFLRSEVNRALCKLQPNKIPGPDRITNNTLKLFSKEITPILTKIFNQIISEEKIPYQWKTLVIILFFKKGDRSNINNYRLISLTTCISKIFSSLIKNRIYPQLDSMQSREQAGFLKGFSTIDQIFTVNQLIEKNTEYNLKLILLFIDFNKAFDTIRHPYLWQALEHQGAPIKIIAIIKEMYRNTTAFIKMDKLGPKFKLERGMKQGDPLSPNLFNCILQEIFWEIN